MLLGSPRFFNQILEQKIQASLKVVIRLSCRKLIVIFRNSIIQWARIHVVILWWLKNHPFNHLIFILIMVLSSCGSSRQVWSIICHVIRCSKIKGPTKDLGLLDGTLPYFELLAGPKLVTPTITQLSPYVTKPRDPLQDISNCL